MAEDKKQKNIIERYRDLPEDLQQALISSNTSDAVMAVGKKIGLAVDKIGELADETGLVMLGITPPGEFIRNLTRRLEVDPAKAKAIAEEVNQTIFQPLRESLKKIHGLGAQPAEKPSAIQAGVALKTESRKPLPTRSEITEKIIPPELKTPELPPAQPEITPKTPTTTSGEASTLIPPIFAKNIPAENQGIQASKPLKDDLEADLEKKLSEARPQENNYQKSADPYREQVEP